MTLSDRDKLQADHLESREQTLKVLKESAEIIDEARSVLRASHKRLREATRKYEERYHGAARPH